MFRVLKEWRFQGLTADSIEIARGAQPFTRHYLDDEKKRQQLRDYCRTFFRTDLNLRILEGVEETARDSSRVETAKKAFVETVSNDLSASVRDILQIFQGEIQDGQSLPEAPFPAAGERGGKEVSR